MRIIQRIIILLFFLSTTSSLYADEKYKLIFAIDLIRHGDRTPIHDFPSSPYPWAQGKGQLTAEGMQQEFQLGTELRKKYIENTHLLPKSYQSNILYVRSTDVDRTLMSAQSLLMGLYPLGTGPYLGDKKGPALPKAFQPIPVHTAPADQDAIFISSIDPNQYNKLLNQYVYSQPEWKAKNAELQSHYRIWSQATGFDITELNDLGRLADTLYIYRVHHIDFDKLSKEDIDQIIDTGKWVLATTFKPKEIGIAVSRPLLTAIGKYIEQASQQNTTLKYVLLSAHDTNIISILSALEAPLSSPPHYASHINFSLLEKSPKNYFVQITYNNQPVFIPGCNNRLCSLQQFLSVANIK